MDFSPLKEFMENLIDAGIPGNSISVYHKNKEVFRFSCGYSNLEEQVKMTGEELLNIYSCSKVATAVAALQLYERGLFLLDDPLYEYISEFRHMYVREGETIKKANNPITLRHLFTHTAGFTYNFSREHVSKLLCEDQCDMSTVSVAKAIAGDPLAFEPGTSWRYSLAHDILGAVVEIISGKKFSDYVTENIFLPLGINDVYYHRTAEIYEKMAQQYRYIVNDESDDIVKLQAHSIKNGGRVVNVGKEMMYEFSENYDSGGAGIVTSISSYAKFANSLAMGGITQEGNRILSKAMIDLLRTNQLNSIQIKSYDWPQLKGYGYGLGVRTMINKAESGSNGPVGEFGWGGAAGANVLVDTDNQYSCFYAHHMLNPLEDYYQPRLRNALYACLG